MRQKQQPHGKGLPVKKATPLIERLKGDVRPDALANFAEMVEELDGKGRYVLRDLVLENAEGILSEKAYKIKDLSLSLEELDSDASGYLFLQRWLEVRDRARFWRP